MVRTEVKISMKKKYSACFYFKLLKSYPNKYIYIVQLKEKKEKKNEKKQRKKKLRTAIKWNYDISPPASASIKELPTDNNV